MPLSGAEAVWSQKRPADARRTQNTEAVGHSGEHNLMAAGGVESYWDPWHQAGGPSSPSPLTLTPPPSSPSMCVEVRLTL